MSLFDNIQNIGNRFQSLQQELGSSITQSTRTVSNFINNINDISGQVQGFSSNLNSFINDFSSPSGLLKKIRSRNLFSEQQQSNRTTARFSSAAHGDWRVRLSIPDRLERSPVISPLIDTEGMVFPYTPTVLIQHDANYDMLAPVHNNYPFPVYQGSSMQQITINGEFIVQTPEEARYWVAAVHYLRSITKMDYGQNSSGNPPPTVRLNGYGDFVFNNIPVVVTMFSIELPQDVDYISTALEVQDLTNTQTIATPAGPQQASTAGTAFSYVPTVSLMSVTLQPIYSRSQVERFDLNKFVQGDYLDNGTGFI